VFGKFIDYHSQVIIITSRLEKDIEEHESFKKYVFERVKEKRKIHDKEIDKFFFALPKLLLDLSDFYIYTRIFLDTLTVCIKRSFKSANKKNWEIIEHSINCFLNEAKIKRYKEKIDTTFFEGLEQKLYWVHDFRKSVMVYYTSISILFLQAQETETWDTTSWTELNLLGEQIPSKEY
jgi:hypothetical protein